MEKMEKIECGCIADPSHYKGKLNSDGVWQHFYQGRYLGPCGRKKEKLEYASNPLTEALALTSGPRQESYGHPYDNFTNIATGWSTLLGIPVSPEQVSLCMLWLKMCRENHKPDFDNLVDMAGYTNTLHMIKEAKK